MQIIITDHYNKTPQDSEFEEVLARRQGQDDWLMVHTLFMDPFDEYFTSDVFNLVREMVAPIC